MKIVEGSAPAGDGDRDTEAYAGPHDLHVHSVEGGRGLCVAVRGDATVGLASRCVVCRGVGHGNDDGVAVGAEAGLTKATTGGTGPRNGLVQPFNLGFGDVAAAGP